MEFPDSKVYEVYKLTYLKRGDGKHLEQFPTAVKIQFYHYKRGWTWYKNGEWIPTGIKKTDPFDKEFNIEFHPSFDASVVRIF